MADSIQCEGELVYAAHPQCEYKTQSPYGYEFCKIKYFMAEGGKLDKFSFCHGWLCEKHALMVKW